MCRNIKPLFNYAPPVTGDEIYAASLQFVRKISGFTKPSKENEPAFMLAVEHISDEINLLLTQLIPHAKPHNRENELAKARERNTQRFSIK